MGFGGCGDCFWSSKEGGDGTVAFRFLGVNDWERGGFSFETHAERTSGTEY